jgi:hypothetical protein
VVYDHYSNSILHAALKNQTAAEIKRGWISMHEPLMRGGNQPKMYILDNEASADLKKGLKKYGLDYQLVPPHVHQRNAAERAMRTFKSHLLAVLATCDPDFPVAEWDRLLFQAELTLNLLRSSRVNPRLSAHACLFGIFDFNKTPLAPPGTKVVVHLKPDQRASWACHGEEGWNVGPSMEHCRCVKCYLPTTSRERDVDALQFFPKKIPFPKNSTEDCLKQAAPTFWLCFRSPLQPFLIWRAEMLPTMLLLQLPPSWAEQTFLQSSQVPPELPRAQIPFHPPRVQFPAHPPRVQIPTAHPPRVPLVVHPPAPSAPTTSIPPPMVQTFSTSLSAPKPAPPRVHKLHPLSRLQQRRNFRANRREEKLQLLQANKFFQPAMNHICNALGKKETIDTLLEGQNGPTWTNGLCNEHGRLAQGCTQNNILGTDTIDFIYQHEVPSDKKVTCRNFICDYRPLKTEPFRVRLTVGGDKLPHDDDAGSPAASLLESKLIINSTISDADKGARFLTADLKDHFLASPMKNNEFMRIKCKCFPEAIRKQCNLDRFVSSDGCVYIRIKKECVD